ncbi:hypothetical protein [Sediminicoccus sp. KRV36]|uniref:hypothetical protein n=1 Tax=Sediminicoccus sp. KRV36 TaxID=3133721 RepID=UPI00200C33F3|nr:hypothetical protein [Sediminicoccus rosea]UPY35523.1 hypothetical protein LHU95_14990 [Sediminicoccus rosea]
MSEPLELRAIRSTLELERAIAARNTARLAEAEELIRLALVAFADSERHPGLIHRLGAFGQHAAPTTTGEA